MNDVLTSVVVMAPGSWACLPYPLFGGVRPGPGAERAI